MKIYYVDVPLSDLLADGYEPQIDEVINVWHYGDSTDYHFEHITKDGIVKMRRFSTVDWKEIRNIASEGIDVNPVCRLPAEQCTISRPAILVAQVRKIVAHAVSRERLTH